MDSFIWGSSLNSRFFVVGGYDKWGSWGPHSRQLSLCHCSLPWSLFGLNGLLFLLCWGLNSTKPFVGLRSNFDKVSLHPASFRPNISTCFRAAIGAENPFLRLQVLALLRAGWLHGVWSSGPERKQSDWDLAPIHGLPGPWHCIGMEGQARVPANSAEEGKAFLMSLLVKGNCGI